MFFSFKRVIFFSCLFFLGISIHAQTVPLRIQGSVSDDSGELSGVTLQITQGGKPYRSVMTDANGNYYFELPLGGDFLIVVSKDTYVSKKFTINTQGVPPDKGTANDPYPIIDASLTMFKKVEGIDYSLLNQPLIKYEYNPKMDNFGYDKNYLEQMKAKMETIKEAEKVVKSKEKEVINGILGFFTILLTNLARQPSVNYLLSHSSLANLQLIKFGNMGN